MFVLVHGAWHGAWCWELLIPELTRHGHRAVAPDLPVDDPSADLESYADVVCDCLSGYAGDDVVVVGHSLGGSVIPLVANRLHIRRLIYLCALLPCLGRSLSDQIADGAMVDPTHLSGLDDFDSYDRRAWSDSRLAQLAFYSDCSERVAKAAVSRMRPQAWTPYRQRFPLDGFPSVACTSIMCADDQILRPAWSRRVARSRIGVDLVELPGGHSPFLSRPRALAEVLVAALT